MAWLLTWLVLAVWVLPAEAGTPTIDPAGQHSATLNGVASGNVAATAAGGAIVIITINIESLATPSPTVTGISGGGLTWAKRFGHTQSSTLCFSSVTCFQDLEYWWAYSSGSLSAVPMTVSFSKTIDFGTLGQTAVHGVLNTAAPWDPAGGLPNFATCSGASSCNMLMSGPTTSVANDFLFALVGVGSNSTSGLSICWKNNILGASEFFVHNSNRDDQVVGFAPVFALQSSTSMSAYLAVQTCSVSDRTIPAWIMVNDALAGFPDVPGSSGHPQVSISE